MGALQGAPFLEQRKRAETLLRIFRPGLCVFIIFSVVFLLHCKYTLFFKI